MIATTIVPFLMAVWSITADPQAPDFEREIAPILEQHCVRCHQPSNQKGDIAVTNSKDLFGLGWIVPGKVDESGILDLVVAEKPGSRPRMPKDGRPLAPADVDKLRRWIASGASWPKSVEIRERSKADLSWWSLQPLKDSSPPIVADVLAEWSGNPIDRWIFASLREKKLKPSPPADPRMLVRRLSFDLTGLPPSADIVEEFARDPSDSAFERLVDQLLSSPSYGEHWGRHWLDVVRFGESTGYERNVIINNAWPFRDYVIRSFNEDKPLDRLIQEHLAGDQLAPGDFGAEVSTGFLIAGPYDNVGNQDAAQAARIRAETIDDIVRATGEAFLGVTIGCARCHNHKFDPISQQDYYRFAAAFAGVFHDQRLLVSQDKRVEIESKSKVLQEKRDRFVRIREAVQKEPASEQREAVMAFVQGQIQKLDGERAALNGPHQWWIGRFQPAPGPFHVFTGGDPQKKAETVPFASPTFLSRAFKGFELPPSASEAERRVALAQWLVAPENPLTPRVLVNRVWGWHFGTGLVDTPSDFGFMGARPSHPDLLDWLARQLQKDGWRLKPMHKRIVMSRAYRQSSLYPRPDDSTANVDPMELDADDRLLWRFPPRRLSGEELRDAMLAVSGQLNRSMGGPGFRLYKYVEDNVATYVPLDAPGMETYRRSVYHQNARASRVDVLTDFDCPDPAFAAPRRASTTTPLQSLTLFNQPLTRDLADALAQSIAATTGDDVEAQVSRLFRLAYTRSPSAAELAAAKTLVAKHGLRALGRAVFNSNEFLYVD